MSRTWHRQLGLWFGLLLVLMAVTGGILLYKNSLLQWHYPQLQLPYQPDLKVWGQVLDQLPQQDYGYARIPTPERPWLELARHDGTLEYFSPAGELLLSRTPYQDWIGWSYQLHLYFFVKDWGHQLPGVVGLLALLLFALGAKLSWPRHWSWRVWQPPAGPADGRRARHWHWLVGLLSLPLLSWTALTGTLVVYNKEVSAGLNWLLQQAPPANTSLPAVNYPIQQGQWTLWLQAAQQVAPQAQIRLVSFRKTADQPLSMRLQLPTEWHPNGRTQLLLDPGNAQLLQLNKATEMGWVSRLMQLLYPLHIAAVGGTLYLLVLLLAALLVPLLWGLGLLWHKGRTAK
ncbi:PepSY domain-containing protein [Rheinheimera sp.]|uniref:PepSY domain-containing protein n=1 Tax=Rheinheimera sp. TaxID=1869214 RepID=UPI00307E81CA